MSTTTLGSSGTYHDTISQRAREIWHERGCPVGQDMQIWLDAERDLVRRGLIPSAPPATANLSGVRRRKPAADEIDQRDLSDRLNEFGEPASRSATSVDPTDLT